MNSWVRSGVLIAAILVTLVIRDIVLEATELRRLPALREEARVLDQRLNDLRVKAPSVHRAHPMQRQIWDLENEIALLKQVQRRRAAHPVSAVMPTR